MTALWDTQGSELACRARLGDRDALAELLRRHYPALLSSCHSMLRDAEAAKDAAQDTAVRALLGIASLQDEHRFGAWLIGIGLNVCRSRLTRAARSAELSITSDDSPRAAPTGDPTFERVLAGELGARVRAAVRALPSGQRDAVARFYLLGLTHAEIAVELGTGPGAVKTRLHKARQTLRTSLTDIREEPVTTTTDPTETSAHGGDDLIPVRVSGLRRTGRDESGRRSHVIFLEAATGQRLPIWIGSAEATALALVLEEVEMPRPGVYQFAAALLAGAGRRVREVRVTDLTADTFYAQVILDDRTTIDARPSDAITLAVLSGVPVLVRAAVFVTANESAPRRRAMIESVNAATDDAHVIAAEASLGPGLASELPQQAI